ncbi:MAG: sigma-70 family RNA polymerase sigma factor [Planctomycetota bacterium]
MHDASHIQLEDLLAERRWLVALATRLVRDAAEAEDVAQETLLRAEGAGILEGRRRGWLARAARNVVSERRRESRRRRAREVERGTREEERLDVDDAVARAELSAEVARLVLELGEDERTAVILRFYEGLSSSEIAEKVGASPPAVRQRISRGLRRIRARLDEEGGRNHWLGAAVAVAADFDGATRTSGLAAAVFPAAAVTAALAAMTWIALGRTGPDPAKPMMRPTETVELAHAGPDLARPETAGAAGRVPVDPPLDGIGIRLVEPESNEPEAGIEWLVVRTGIHDQGGTSHGLDLEGKPDPEPIASGTTRADGIVRFEVPEDPLVHLVIPRSSRYSRGSWPILVADHRDSIETYALSAGATVRGRAIDDRGLPVAGALLIADRFGIGLDEVGRSEADGRFTVGRLTPFPRAFVLSEENQPVPGRIDEVGLIAVRADAFQAWPEAAPYLGTTLDVARARDADVDVGDVVLPRPCTIHGRVLDGARSPVAEALVVMGPNARYLASGLPDVSPELAFGIREDGPLPHGTSRTGVDGSFEIHLFRGSDRALPLAALTPRGGSGHAEIPSLSPGSVHGPVELIVNEPESVEVRLVDDERPDRLPLWPDPERRELELLIDLDTPARRSRSHRLVASKEGTFRIACAALGDTSTGATILVPGYEPAAFAFDGSERLEIRLRPRPRLRVRIVPTGAAAAQVERVSIAAAPLAPQVDDDGVRIARSPRRLSQNAIASVRFAQSINRPVVLPMTTDDPQWVYVQPSFAPPGHASPPPTAFGPFAVDASECTIELPFAGWVPQQSPGNAFDDARPARLLARTVSSASQEPIAAAFHVEAEGRRSYARSRDGALDQRVNVISDNAVVLVSARGHRRLTVSQVRLAAGETTDLGTIGLEPLRIVRGRLIDRSGTQIEERRRIRFVDAELGAREIRSERDGTFELEVTVAPPSTIEIGTREGLHNAYLELPVQSAAEECDEITVTVPSWRSVEVEVTELPLVWASYSTHVLAGRADGTSVRLQHRGLRDGAAVYSGELPPGEWVVASGPSI